MHFSVLILQIRGASQSPCRNGPLQCSYREGKVPTESKLCKASTERGLCKAPWSFTKPYREGFAKPLQWGALLSLQVLCEAPMERGINKAIQMGLFHTSRGFIHTYTYTLTFSTDMGYFTKTPIYVGFCRTPWGFMRPLQRGALQSPYTEWALQKPLYRGGFKKFLIRGGFVHKYTHSGLFPRDTGVLQKAPIEKRALQSPYREGALQSSDNEELCKAPGASWNPETEGPLWSPYRWRTFIQTYMHTKPL